MEIAETLHRQELSESTEDLKLAELIEKAKERWWKLQVFLGKNAMTRLIAMEGVGTAVDVGLMGSGMHDPLTREPIAAGVDALILKRLLDVNESESSKEPSSKKGQARKWLGILAMLGTVVAAQKTGLAVAEHTGLSQGYDPGVQFGAKWGALLGISGANTLRQRTS